MKNIKRKATNLVVLAAIAVFSATPFRSFAPPPPCTNTVQNLNDSGPGSLRAALLNATNSEVITFCPFLSGNLNVSFEFYVSNSVTILGPGANVLTLKGNTVFRIFYINPGLNVTIAGLTIDNGGTFQDTPRDGAGIYNDHSSLTLSNCNLSNNQVFGSGNGGAIYNNAGGGGTSTVMVVNCTLVNNSAGSLSSGGAIYNNGQVGHAEVTLINSTLSGNRATSGAAIENVGEPASGFVTIKNCTFNNNGIHNNLADTVVTIGSTILNASGLSMTSGGQFISLGYNVSSDNGGGFLTQPTDQINTDPQLGPLQNNGGPTFTHAPLCGSPAIDKGTNFSGLATDQRSAPRTFDDPNVANVGDGTDIGAVESPIFRFTVLDTSDSGPGSLRAAITNANSSPGADLIVFDPGVSGTITLTSGELLISDCLYLLGPGAMNIAINGNYPNSTNRVFHITPSNTVSIAGLTVTNGFASNGGGIYNDHSTLMVSNCVLAGNSAISGGALYNSGVAFGSATMTVIGSTLSSNTANEAAAIMNNGSSGNASLTVINSTLVNNRATTFVGTIWNDGEQSGKGMLTILNCTFSGNSAGSFNNGMFNDGANSGTATLKIGSTIIDAVNSGNIANSGGTVTSLGYNLSSDDFGGFLTGPSDQTNTPPLLGTLQLNGGQTPTLALLCGSPAIDAGTNFSASVTDQTGGARTFDDPGIANAIGGDGTDIGAYERQQSCNQPPVAVCTNITVSADSNCVANASIDNGSYDPDAGDSITNSVQTPAGPYILGTNMVTLTVTDSHGETNSCQALVIVVDTTRPTIDCPGNIVVTNDSGQCSAVVSYTVSASDNCSSVNLSEDFPSGSTFSKGTNTVTVTGVDLAGNTNTCTFTVTVLEKEAPLVMCRPAPNPSGKISEPGKNGGTNGVNPNGYYQLLAKDNCDANPSIYVKDTKSGFVAGPFKDGDIVRLKHAGASASSVAGSAPVVAVISLKGNGLVVAQDVDGNRTADGSGCVLPVSLK